jgi:hypothetical protein
VHGRAARCATVLVCFFVVSAAGLAADYTTTNFNGWYIYFGDHPFAKKWEWHVEGQWRRNNGITRWQQLLLRSAIAYKVTPKLMLSQGYGYIPAYPYGDSPAIPRKLDEHRLYQEALYRHSTGKVGWIHRLRFEERWLETNGARRFQNRFRYFVKATIPLPRTKKWYAGLYNEILIHVPPNLGASGAYDHNRAYVALGRRLHKYLRMELGYMNQYLLQRNGQVYENNHTLQLVFFGNAPLR